MMDFTIYTIGDIESFYAALNAVAMFFNPSNTTAFVGQTGVVGGEYKIGLGGMAATALMFALIVALMKGVINLKFELGELIIIVFLYAVMFVPKFDVVLEDYFSGEVKKVDNVPLGIAFPGAFISAFTISMSETLAQGYQTAQGQQFSMKDGGFAYPLKILNGLRKAPISFAKSEPHISNSVQAFYLDCVYGRDGYDHNKYMKSIDSWGLLRDFGATTQGFTLTYSDATPNGAPSTCADASKAVDNMLTQIFNPAANGNISPSPANPSGVSKVMELTCKAMGSGASVNKGCPTINDYERSFSALTRLSGAEARMFAVTTLSAQIIQNSSMCAASASDNADLSKCLPLVSAMEQYKDDAVAGGSMFQKTMFSSMSVMLFLFYTFAPIVAILMLAMGAQGIKLVGSYLMFGIWTQSWLPFATILNFYIQNKVESEVLKFGDGRGVITPSNYSAFYDSVTTSLAAASDLLASTPIITLALISGSIFALTGVASKMSGRDYYDEKQNSIAGAANSPYQINTPEQNGTLGGVSLSTSRPTAPEISFSQANSKMLAQSTEEARTAAEQFSNGQKQSFMDNFSKTKSFGDAYNRITGTGVDLTRDTANSMTQAYAQSNEAKFQEALESGKVDTSAFGANVGADVGAALSKSVPIGKAIPDSVKQMIAKVIPGISMGANYTWQDLAQNKQAKSYMMGIGAKNDLDRRLATSQGVRETKSLSGQEVLKYSTDFMRGTSGSIGQEASQMLTSARSFAEKSMETASNANNSGVSASLDGRKLATMLDDSANGPAFYNDLQNAKNALSSNPAFMNAYNTEMKLRANSDVATASGNNIRPGDALDAYATLRALQQTEPAEFNRIASTHLLQGFDSGSVDANAVRSQVRGAASFADRVTTGSQDGVTGLNAISQEVVNKTESTPNVVNGGVTNKIFNGQTARISSGYKADVAKAKADDAARQQGQKAQAQQKHQAGPSGLFR